MIIQFTPSVLEGEIHSIPSKSASHRALICAALADGRSDIKNLVFSNDIEATIACLTALGARFERLKNGVRIWGLSSPPKIAVLPCKESGSTLRFLLPIAAALGVQAEFQGAGRLPQRPITPYLDTLPEHGVTFDYNGTMPFSIHGILKGGRYEIAGNVSSQFITGLLFALSLLDQDSEIIITEDFESRPYVEMTLWMLDCFGIYAKLDGNRILIPGNQRYQAQDVTVEGDYSQAAFYFAAGALSKSVKVNGLSYDTAQGDRAFLDILQQAGAQVEWLENSIRVSPGKLKPFTVDVRDIPDLVPILTVLACFCEGQSRITHADRLKIKESDRLQSIAECLNAAGGKVEVRNDGLLITGVDALRSCRVDSYNDHRIAMAMAIASLRCSGTLVLDHAETVRKSYPDFYRDFQMLGGNVNVLDL